MLNLKRLPAGTSLLNWNSELPSSGTGDPLGMTLRVGARLGAELLHCITSITPRARYYSFFPWAFQRAQDQLGRTANFSQAMRQVLIVERAMTLGAVLYHEGRACYGGGLQGSTNAVTLMEGQSRKSIDLGNWSHLRDNRSGFDAYKGSLINLHLFSDGAQPDESDDDEADSEGTALTSGELSAQGRRLAEAFGRAVASTAFAKLKTSDAPVPLKLIEEFGRSAGLCELRAADEFDLLPLRNLFFATENDSQSNSHYRRRMSLLLLLWTVETIDDADLTLSTSAFDDLTFYRVVTHDDGQHEAVETPPALVDISERWRIFHFHNYLTTALESLLAGVVRAVRYHPAGQSVADILEAFDTADARSALGELLSVEPLSSFMDLTPAKSLGLVDIDFAGIDETDDAAVVFAVNPFVERALRDALIEHDVVSGPAGPAVAALLTFTLLLRYDLAVDEAHKGWNTQKVVHPSSDVAMPTVARALELHFGKDWWHVPNRTILSRLLNQFVIRQHETMSYEKGFGGSPPLFRIDGTMIVGTDVASDDIGPGNPRFFSAIQVLRDLRLIKGDPDEERGLTPDGKNMLDSFLAGSGS